MSLVIFKGDFVFPLLSPNQRTIFLKVNVFLIISEKYCPLEDDLTNSIHILGGTL
jgi:hypothetical protein